MKLTNLAPRLSTLDTRITKATTATQRMTGRRAVERRVRWLTAYPLCAKCLEEGRTTAATTPDHIVPVTDGGRDDDSNLQSLCTPCHAVKTAAEAAARGRPLA